MSEALPEDTAQKSNVQRALIRIAAEGVKFMGDEPGSRESLIETARDLIAAAESPVESLLWNAWTQVRLLRLCHGISADYMEHSQPEQSRRVLRWTFRYSKPLSKETLALRRWTSSLLPRVPPPNLLSVWPVRVSRCVCSTKRGRVSMCQTPSREH
jgi:hypothetical protein